MNGYVYTLNWEIPNTWANSQNWLNFQLLSLKFFFFFDNSFSLKRWIIFNLARKIFEENPINFEIFNFLFNLFIFWDCLSNKSSSGFSFGRKLLPMRILWTIPTDIAKLSYFHCSAESIGMYSKLTLDSPNFLYFIKSQCSLLRIHSRKWWKIVLWPPLFLLFQQPLKIQIHNVHSVREENAMETDVVDGGVEAQSDDEETASSMSEDLLTDDVMAEAKLTDKNIFNNKNLAFDSCKTQLKNTVSVNCWKATSSHSNLAIFHSKGFVSKTIRVKWSS